MGTSKQLTIYNTCMCIELSHFLLPTHHDICEKVSPVKSTEYFFSFLHLMDLSLVIDRQVGDMPHGCMFVVIYNADPCHKC